MADRSNGVDRFIGPRAAAAIEKSPILAVGNAILRKRSPIAGRSPPVRAVGTGLAIALLQFGSPNIPEIRVPAALIMDP